MTKELEKQREKEGPKDDEPKTKEELRYEKMTDVVTLSTDARHVNLVDSVKGSIDGRIKTLESEIEIDNSRKDTLEGASAYKLEQLSELKQRSAKLEADIGFRMADIANEIEKDKDETSEEVLRTKTKLRKTVTTNKDYKAVGSTKYYSPDSLISIYFYTSLASRSLPRTSPSLFQAHD